MRRYGPHLVVIAAVASALVFGSHHPAHPGHHGAHVVVPPGQAGPRVGPSYLYPDPASTPGVTNLQVSQDNVKETICVTGWTATIRPAATVTNRLKEDQLSGSYAIRYAADKTPSHYEEDHFIALELGGNPTDTRNLWPEMWGTPNHPLTSQGPFLGVIGAKAKDHVENALNKEVCAGTLTLQEAQDIIRTDWFKYYKDKILK